jgi:hypothetical protein
MNWAEKRRQQHTHKIELKRIRKSFAEKIPVGNRYECGNKEARNC